MPSDYFDGVPNYNDIPDYRRLAREIGQEIAATRPPNVLAHSGRAFWKLTDADRCAVGTGPAQGVDTNPVPAGIHGELVRERRPRAH